MLTGWDPPGHRRRVGPPQAWHPTHQVGMDVPDLDPPFAPMLQNPARRWIAATTRHRMAEMIKQKGQILSLWFLVWDLAWTALAWVGAYHLRFTYEIFPITKEAPDFSVCAQHIPLIVVLAAVAYRITGQYVIHRFRRLREELVAVAK